MPMVRATDCLCCSEDDPASEKKGSLKCVTLHEKFELVCLDRDVLDVALTGYFESRCDVDHRVNRLGCVRAYITVLWCCKVQQSVVAIAPSAALTATLLTANTLGGYTGVVFGRVTADAFLLVSFMRSATPIQSDIRTTTVASSSLTFKFWKK